MDIDSGKAHAFFSLAKEGSFSRAARVLGISQSALSQKIARLENELETTLVIRSSRELQLTNSGRELVRYYKTKIELDRSFLHAIARVQGRSGELSVAGFSSIFRSALIPITAKLQKNSQFRFNLSSREIYELEGLLLSGKADFIITTDEVNREHVHNLLIGEEELVHVLPKNGDEGLPFLDHDERDSTTFQFFKLMGKERKIERSFLDDIYGIIEGVREGLGQAIVSKHLVNKIKDMQLVEYRKKVRQKVFLSYFDQTYFPKHHRDFINSMEIEFKKYL